MPLSRRIAELNKAGLNKLTRRIVPWAPGFGLVIHRGRRSGREFRTPVNVFATPTGFRIALTYGPRADWVRNVLAAGGCELIHRRRTSRLVNPRVVHDETVSGYPAFVRFMLRRTGSYDALLLDLPAAESLNPSSAEPEQR